MIHPTAIISESARMGEDVSIGPYSIIGDDVTIGAGTWIGPHVVMNGPAHIGSDNKIYQYCSIGDVPQDKKFSCHNESCLEIGDRNVIREFCSINRGAAPGGGRTVIGNDNWIMAYVHIAHDCMVGSNVVFANNATLAGHVIIQDYATLGGFTGVHQFCRVGRHSFTAISSVVTKDVPPYVMVAGNTAKPYGLNREGLRRKEFDAGTIDSMKKAYKTLYRDGLTLGKAIHELEIQAQSSIEVKYLVDFIKESDRGIVR